MNTVLTIGAYSFLLESAAVAEAIRETLKAAPQVDRNWSPGSGETEWTPVLADNEAETFTTTPATDREIRYVTNPAPASRLAAVVLGEPIRTGRKTRRTLATTAKEIKR